MKRIATLLLLALVFAPFLLAANVPQSWDGRPPTSGSRELQVAVTPLDAGDGVTIDARGMRYLTVIVEDGGEATISRVDAPTTTSHSATVSLVNAAGSQDLDIFLVDWPFYRVTTADQAARVAVAK